MMICGKVQTINLTLFSKVLKVFKYQVFHTVCKALGISNKYHCPHHPQLSGLIERSIKNKITQLLFLFAGSSRVSVLPAVLMSKRAMTNRTSELSPFEILTGRDTW